MENTTEIVLSVIAIAFLATYAYGTVSAAPWLPTKGPQIKQLTNLFPVTGSEIVYDLGCGTGGLLFELAKKYPNATFIGYDISLLPLCWGWMRKLFGGSKYKNVRLYWGNFFTKNISDANIVFVFLLSHAYKKLMFKFASELSDDATVIVEAWPFSDLKSERTVTDEGLLPVYFYSGKQFRDS